MKRLERTGRPCVALIEINSTGDPGSGKVGAANGQTGFSLTTEQLAHILNALLLKAESLEMIYFTGSDPAGHPQLGDFIEMAYEKGVPRIGLQCDGRRIARDDGLLATLARLKPVIFLEFEGFDETSSLILHGRRDLPFEAMRALDRLAETGLSVALLTRVDKGANLQEIGAIAAYGFEHPAVFCVLFRPYPPHEERLPLQATGRLDASGIIESLKRQSHGLLDGVDFLPTFCCLPCRHFAATLPESDQPPFWLGIYDFMTPWCYDRQKARNCPLVVFMPDGRSIPYCLFNALGEASSSK